MTDLARTRPERFFSEIAERFRNEAAVMVASEQERRAPRIIIFMDRVNIRRPEEQ